MPRDFTLKKIKFLVKSSLHNILMKGDNIRRLHEGPLKS